MSRHSLASFSTLLAAILLLAQPATASAQQQPRRPNLILILADDFSYECVGANGGTSYKTPNLDRLAAGASRAGKFRTLDEVARCYGITRERIRQIEARSLLKLRQPLRSQRLEGFTDRSEM